MNSAREALVMSVSAPVSIMMLTEWLYIRRCGQMAPGGGEGVLPYMGYIGMCGPKGYGFSALSVINRVSILADFGHFGHK